MKEFFTSYWQFMLTIVLTTGGVLLFFYSDESKIQATAFALLITGILMLIGGSIALFVLDIIGFIRSRSGKISVIIGIVLLPVLLYQSIWFYMGIVFCNYCKSVSENCYTEDHQCIQVEICNKCVEYIYCNDNRHYKLSKYSTPPQVCLGCFGHIEMRNDQFGEFLLKITMVILLAGYYCTIIFYGIFMLISNCLKKRSCNGSAEIE